MEGDKKLTEMASRISMNSVASLLATEHKYKEEIKKFDWCYLGLTDPLLITLEEKGEKEFLSQFPGVKYEEWFYQEKQKRVIEMFEKVLDSHDWHYIRSDDMRVYRRGLDSEYKIKFLVKKFPYLSQQLEKKEQIYGKL